MNKRIVSIIVACCFFNVVLYTPAFAVESYVNTYEKNFEQLINKYADDTAFLNNSPAFKMFIQKKSEATSNPESFDARSFIQSLKDTGQFKNMEYNALEPFIEQLENLQSAEPETLLRQTKIIISSCTSLIEAGCKNAVLCGYLKQTLIDIEQKLDVVLNTPEALNKIQSDNSTNYTTRASVYWVFANGVRLLTMISIYGAGTSLPVISSEVNSVLAMLYYVNNLIAVGTGSNPASTTVSFLLSILGTVSDIALIFSSITGGQIDVLVVHWVISFISQLGFGIFVPYV